MIRLMFFSASSQRNSVNSKLAQATAHLIESTYKGIVEVTFINLSDFDVPTFDGEGIDAVPLPKEAKRFGSLLHEHDGLFVGSDEYTGAYSAILRNLIGWLTVKNGPVGAGFKNKPIVICGASSRGVGSMRGQPALQQLLVSLGAKVIYQHIRLGTTMSAFQQDGELTQIARKQLLEKAIPELLGAVKSN